MLKPGSYTLTNDATGEEFHVGFEPKQRVINPAEFAYKVRTHLAWYQERCWNSLPEEEKQRYYNVIWELEEQILRALGYGEGFDLLVADESDTDGDELADHEDTMYHNTEVRP